MQVERVLERLGGVARLAELTTLCGRPDVDAAVTDGRIVRLRRGSYALPSTDRAIVEAARRNGVVSHTSAALLHGWKVKRSPSEPMVTVPRSSSRLAAEGVRLFYGERGQLRQAAAAAPRTGRARAMRVVEAASADAANPFESVLRAIAHGVPGLDVVPPGEIGFWTHPDLVDFLLRIAIEADSFEYHAVREAFEYDARRYTGLVRERWVVLRFTWDDVMHKPDDVRAVLTDVVRWRSTEQRRASTGSSAG